MLFSWTTIKIGCFSGTTNTGAVLKAKAPFLSFTYSDETARNPKNEAALGDGGSLEIKTWFIYVTFPNLQHLKQFAKAQYLFGFVGFVALGDEGSLEIKTQFRFNIFFLQFSSAILI